MGEEGSGIRGEGTEISLHLQRSFRFMTLSKEGRERGSKRGALSLFQKLVISWDRLLLLLLLHCRLQS